LPYTNHGEVVKIIKDNVGRWMIKKVYTAKEKDSVLEAAELMNKRHIGTLVVVDGKKPVGIVTERDILNKVVAKNLKADEVKVGDIMTADIKCADIDAPISKVSCDMTLHKIKRMPITKKGRLVGIITSSDLLRIMARQWACQQ
jgi:CBS domain-containing protein